MKITGFEVIPFETTVDRISFGQLLSDYSVVQTVTKVTTDEGAEGYYFGGHFHGDQDGLLPGDRASRCASRASAAARRRLMPQRPLSCDPRGALCAFKRGSPIRRVRLRQWCLTVGDSRTPTTDPDARAGDRHRR